MKDSRRAEENRKSNCVDVMNVINVSNHLLACIYSRNREYWAIRQLIGRYFSETTIGVASFALALGTSAEWLGYGASF